MPAFLGLPVAPILRPDGPITGTSNFPAVRMTQPPTIDGVVDPQEWQGVPSGAQWFDTQGGALAPQDGQFWLAYDQDFIYFACRFDDPNPGGIVANEYRTNSQVGGDDHVVLRIDPYGTLNGFNDFYINPRGATQIQIAGGKAAKREWSGEFIAKGRVTDKGWEAEAKIPWKLMSLPAAGKKTLRFQVRRHLQNLRRDYAWRYVGDNGDNFGRWLAVDVPKVPFERVVKFLPYGYFGGAKGLHTIWNAGVDIKSQLNPQTNAVVSILPDFRNIENQVLSLDFSYFERLIPEARPFFQEGSDYFQTGFDTRIFTSQRVRQFDLGEKVYGKLDDRTNYGVMNVTDFGRQNVFVAGANTKFNSSSDARFAVVSNRENGRSNDGAYVNGSKQMGPFNFYFGQMFTRDEKVGTGQWTNTGFFYNKGLWNGSVDLTEVTSNFLPRLGFVQEQNAKGGTMYTEYSVPWKQGPFKQFNQGIFAAKFWHLDGDKYREQVDAFGGLSLRNKFLLQWSGTWGTFEGSHDHILGIGFQWPDDSSTRRIGFGYNEGSIDGHHYVQQTAVLAYRPIDKLQLSLSSQELRHFDRSTLSIFSFNWDLGRDLSVGGRAVATRKGNNAYVAFKRSGARGVEYFLIVGDPNAVKYRNSLILKVVWPLEIRQS